MMPPEQVSDSPLPPPHATWTAHTAAVLSVDKSVLGEIKAGYKIDEFCKRLTGFISRCHPENINVNQAR